VAPCPAKSLEPLAGSSGDLNLDDLIASKQTGRYSDEADLEVLRGLRTGAKRD